MVFSTQSLSLHDPAARMLSAAQALIGQGSPQHYVLFYPLSVSMLLRNLCSAAFILNTDLRSERVWKSWSSWTPLAPSICPSFFSSLLYSHTDYVLVMCIILKFSSCALKMKIIFWWKKVMGHAEWKTFFIFFIFFILSLALDAVMLGEFKNDNVKSCIIYEMCIKEKCNSIINKHLSSFGTGSDFIYLL